MKNENLTIVRRIMEEGFGEANLKIIDQYVSENFIEHQFGAKNGKEGLINTIKQLHNGLSGLRYELQKSIQEGDTVWVHYKATAIQSGIFMHMPPSGKQISIDILDIFHFENGILKEHWGVPDRFAAMMQLGVFDKKEIVS
jgi:predicted ester cyclase